MVGDGRDGGPLEGDRRAKATVPRIDREVGADRRRHRRPGDPEGGREQCRHPHQTSGLVVAGQEKPRRSERVVLVVLLVLCLDPRPGSRAVPGGQLEHLKPVRDRVAGDDGVASSHASRSTRCQRGVGSAREMPASESFERMRKPSRTS